MSFTKTGSIASVLFLALCLQPLKGEGGWDGQKPSNLPETQKPLEETAVEKVEKLFGPRSGEVLRLTLDGCIKRAMTYNPELQVADYSIEAAGEKINEASRLGHPLLEYEYDLGPVPRDVKNAVSSFFSGNLTVFNKVKLGVGIPIETFGKVKTGKELAEKGVEAEQARKVMKKSEIVVRVKQLYYGIQLAREVGRLLTSARDGVRDEIQKRENEGGNDPSELLKLKLFRAELEKRIEEGDKKEILARSVLRVQLGIDPEIAFDIATDKMRPVNYPQRSYEQYREQALAQRPDLKLLDIGYEAKEKQMALEKRLMAPNLAVGGFFELGNAPGVTGITATDDFTNPLNYTRAGFGLQLKGELDFHTSMSKVRQARVDLYKIDVQRNLAEDGVELEVKEAFLDVRNAKMDMERAEEAGKLSRQLLFLTQSNYDIGLADSKDLIDALSSFLQTRGQYFEAIFNYNSDIAKLDQKIGHVPE